MGMLAFSVVWRLLLLTPRSSYIEGIVRGYRNGLLTGANYTNMTQCETIDGELPCHATMANSVS